MESVTKSAYLPISEVAHRMGVRVEMVRFWFDTGKIGGYWSAGQAPMIREDDTERVARQFREAKG